MVGSYPEPTAVAVAAARSMVTRAGSTAEYAGEETAGAGVGSLAYAWTDQPLVGHGQVGNQRRAAVFAWLARRSGRKVRGCGRGADLLTSPWTEKHGTGRC